MNIQGKVKIELKKHIIEQNMDTFTKEGLNHLKTFLGWKENENSNLKRVYVANKINFLECNNVGIYCDSKQIPFNKDTFENDPSRNYRHSNEDIAKDDFRHTLHSSPNSLLFSFQENTVTISKTFKNISDEVLTIKRLLLLSLQTNLFFANATNTGIAYRDKYCDTYIIRPFTIEQVHFNVEPEEEFKVSFILNYASTNFCHNFFRILLINLYQLHSITTTGSWVMKMINTSNQEFDGNVYSGYIIQSNTSNNSYFFNSGSTLYDDVGLIIGSSNENMTNPFTLLNPIPQSNYLRTVVGVDFITPDDSDVYTIKISRNIINTSSGTLEIKEIGLQFGYMSASYSLSRALIYRHILDETVFIEAGEAYSFEVLLNFDLSHPNTKFYNITCNFPEYLDYITPSGYYLENAPIMLKATLKANSDDMKFLRWDIRHIDDSPLNETDTEFILDLTNIKTNIKAVLGKDGHFWLEVEPNIPEAVATITESGFHLNNTDMVFTATAKPGYVFKHWSFLIMTTWTETLGEGENNTLTLPANTIDFKIKAIFEAEE